MVFDIANGDPVSDLISQIGDLYALIRSNVQCSKVELRASFQKIVKSILQRQDELEVIIDSIAFESISTLDKQLKILKLAKTEHFINNACTVKAFRSVQECVQSFLSAKRTQCDPQLISFLADNTSLVATVSEFGQILTQLPVDYPSGLPLRFTKGVHRTDSKLDMRMWLSPQRPCSVVSRQQFQPKGSLSCEFHCDYPATNSSSQRTSFCPGSRECRTTSYSSSSGKTDIESFEVLGESPRSEPLNEWLIPDKSDLTDMPTIHSLAPTMQSSSTQNSHWLASTTTVIRPTDLSVWLAPSVSNATPILLTSTTPTIQSDKALWLSPRTSVSTVDENRMIPLSLFPTGSAAWLSRSPTPLSDTDQVTKKLFALAAQDEDKEVDHAEIVAMVCHRQDKPGCDRICKSFAECNRGDCASRLVTAASAVSPTLNQWLTRQAVLNANLESNQCTDAILADLHKIVSSGVSQWLAGCHPSPDVPSAAAGSIANWSQQWLAPVKEKSSVEHNEHKIVASVCEADTEDDDEDISSATDDDVNIQHRTKLAQLLTEEMSTRALLELIPPYPHHIQSHQKHDHKLSPVSSWLIDKSFLKRSEAIPRKNE